MEKQKRVIIGTAGHIDHGKTALVKALTGIDTDTSKEEKARGITIDIGIAPLVLPSGILAGIVDVPGHEKFIHNMVAGASGIDFVLLVIAADEGVMPQTKEHLEICELLGIKDGIVVITKIDLVEKDWLELVTEDVKNFVKGTFLEKAPFVYFSAVTLEGKEELITLIDEKAQKVVQKPINEPFRLPVDGVFSIKGFGTVVRGTLLSGKVRKNQEAMIYPKKILTKIRNIQIFGKNVEESIAGSRTALNLSGISKEEVTRGDVVAEPEVLEPSNYLDVDLQVLRDIKRGIKCFEEVFFHVGTSRIKAKVILLGKKELSPGERDVVQIVTESPVCVWRGDRFILRRGPENITIGGGIILNPCSYKRKRTKPWEREEVEFIKKARDEELFLFYVNKKEFLGIEEKRLKILLSVFGEKFKELEEKIKNQIVLIKEGEKNFYFSRENFENLKKEILKVLEKFHRENPFSPGLNKELLKSRISSFIHQGLFEKAIEDLIKQGRITKDKEIISLSGFKHLDKEGTEKLKKEVEKKFLEEGITPRNFEDVLVEFKDNYKAAKEIFEALLRERVLIRLTDKIVMHSKVIERVKEEVIKFLKSHGEMQLSDFKKLINDAFGKSVSRKYVVPLIEFMDKEKVTLRIGDKRILRKQV